MVEQLRLQKVFLLAGVNNVSRWNYEKTIEERYGLLLQRLNEIGCEVYVRSILIVREPSKVRNEHILKANEIIEKLADKYDMIYIDIAAGFKDAEGYMNKDLTKDGIHLNKFGYSVWVEQR